MTDITGTTDGSGITGTITSSTIGGTSDPTQVTGTISTTQITGTITTAALTGELSEGEGTMRNIWISTTGQAEGNLTLSDTTNWACQYSYISSIKVVTSSTDWDMWLCETSAFNTSLITSRQIAANRSGNFDITIAREYNSDSNNVYLIYTDNSGANNASILITGTERSH